MDADWTHLYVSLFPSELAMIPETINYILNDPKSNSTKEKFHHSILTNFSQKSLDFAEKLIYVKDYVKPYIRHWIK